MAAAEETLRGIAAMRRDMMTHLLQEAFEKASGLPDALQNELAQQWIEEVEWELRWDDTLERSQALLENLALNAFQDAE